MQYKRCHDHKWIRELIESVFLKFYFNQYQSIKVGGFEVTTFRTNEKIDFRLGLVLKPQCDIFQPPATVCHGISVNLFPENLPILS